VASSTAAVDVLATNGADCVLVSGAIDGLSAMQIFESIQAAAPTAPVIFSDQEITAGQAVE
jgi:hypothetical protein